MTPEEAARAMERDLEAGQQVKVRDYSCLVPKAKQPQTEELLAWVVATWELENARPREAPR